LDQSLYLLRGDDPVLAVLASNPLTAMLSAALTRKIHHDRFSGDFSLKYLILLCNFFDIFCGPGSKGPAAQARGPRRRPSRQDFAAFDQRICKTLPGPEKPAFSKI
jgi:hypothetical protein